MASWEGIRWDEEKKSEVFQWEKKIFSIFSVDLQGWKKEKNGSNLMHQITQKSSIYKGASPLDPRHSPETIVLWERKFYVLDKVVIVWFFQEKVSIYDLYKCYAANSCVTNTFCRIIVTFKGSILGSAVRPWEPMTDMMLGNPMIMHAMPWGKMSKLEIMT